MSHLIATQTLTVDQFALGTLILRIALGVVMIAHGYNHIFGGGKIAGTGRWFESLGMKPGWLHAWTASLVELGAGVMLLAGLFIPLAAAGALGVMVVAWITNHLKNGFFIFRPGEGWEYVGFISFTALALGTLGAGKWSLDHAIGFNVEYPWGFAITAIAGIGGAFLLLLIFWRPEKKAKEEPAAT